MSNPHHDEEKLTHVVDCVTDIDDYPPIEKCETNDSNELKSDQKIVLVTGGAGNNLSIGSINHRSWRIFLRSRWTCVVISPASERQESVNFLYLFPVFMASIPR